MNLSNRTLILVMSLVLLLIGQALASEAPRGLLLRRGLMRWQLTLKETSSLVEQNIRPQTLYTNLLKGQNQNKQEGFRCDREGTSGVTQCIWACCVDLGEKDIVEFATLWFHNDRFYAYDVAFNTAQFPRLFATLEEKFGKPSKEEQESQVNPAFMLGEGFGSSSYIVNTKRWDSEDTVILLADRGGQGKLLAGHMYVVYLPIAREIPSKKQD
jgi:hypothetical protein